MPQAYDFPDEDLPVPSDGMDFYEPVHSAPSEHVTLTSGAQPGVQSTAGLEGLSDLLEGLAKGTVTVINAVNKPPEAKSPPAPPPTPPTSPPAQPKTPPPAAPPVTVLVNPPPAAPKSNAAVIAVGVGVVAAVAALGIGVALVSRPPRRSRPAFLAGRDEPIEVELVPTERQPLPWERQLTAGERP